MKTEIKIRKRFKKFVKKRYFWPIVANANIPKLILVLFSVTLGQKFIKNCQKAVKFY
jgi:hypothetical protein